MAEIYNLQQLVAMRDTKANVEALSGTLEEIVIAFATDTKEIGIYTNGGWIWIGGGSGLSAGEILIEDGSSAPPVMLTTEDEDDFLYEG
jgi:hypothetical protein